MHIRLLAIGDRQPGWVDAGFDGYRARFPREWRFESVTIPTTRRARNAPADKARDADSEALLAKLNPAEKLILLDERGKPLSSRQFADCLSGWQADGRDIAFAIGGPDGVSDACRKRAEFTLALSHLTLPHGLARVVLAEQLYRAASVLAGHPYHRA